MLGGVLIGLAVLGLAAELGYGWLLLPILPGLGLLSRAVDSQLYWQFAFLVPSLPLAFGTFLLRYRVHGVTQLKGHSINCATFMLIFAGVSLVMGKVAVLLLH